VNRPWAWPVALVLLAGCADITYSNERLEAMQRELDRQYDLWTAQAIPAYEYRFARECPCRADLTRTVLVSVQDTVVIAVIYADSGTAVPDSAYRSYFTVEGLFQQARLAISALADSLVVQYDPDLHYPTTIVVDQNRFLVNDELSLFASQLTRK
jgi:hypothetical protein